MAKKRSYKQNEVVKELDIQPYVLRYWETEFPFLKQGRKASGPRTFSVEEVDQLRRIRVLLYEEGYTIAGARKRIDAERAGEAQPAVVPARTTRKAAEKGTDPAAFERLRDGVSEALADARSLLARLER